jgi:hypothetical protein
MPSVSPFLAPVVTTLNDLVPRQRRASACLSPSPRKLLKSRPKSGANTPIKRQGGFFKEEVSRFFLYSIRNLNLNRWILLQLKLSLLTSKSN